MPPKGETAGELALTHRAAGRGFALVEALVAAALLGWILLVGLDFLVLEQRAEERLVAHRQAMRAIETAVEAVRADMIPMEEGTIELGDLSTSSSGIQLSLEIENDAIMSDLFLVRVKARYKVRKEIHSRDLETLVWRP